MSDGASINDVGGGAPVVIVMSTFNGERFIREQVTSILDQTAVRWRLIIRDDGSTDGTPDILRALEAEDDRIHVLADSGRNVGVTQSFSRLIESCKGLPEAYVMCCDQDDIWKPDKIESTLRFMHEQERLHPAVPVLVHTDLAVVDESGASLHPSMWAYAKIQPSLNQLPRLLVQNTVTGCTMMINRRLLDLLGPIPESAALHDWWLALVAALFGVIAPLPRSTIDYRQHGGNVAGIRAHTGWSGWLRSALGRCSPAAFRAMRMRLVLTPARQAGALAQVYGHRTTASQRDLLMDFAGISRRSWLARRWLLIDRGLLRQRPQHNLSLLLLV